MSSSFLVFGAGAWGTALSIQLAKSSNNVVLSSFDNENLGQIKKHRENKKYLPGFKLPKAVGVESFSEKLVTNPDSIVVCVKSPYFKRALLLLKNNIGDKNLVWATKGFDPDNGGLLSSMVAGVVGTKTKTAILSGPTFAEELAIGKPAAITLATKTIDNPVLLAESMSNESLRVYLSSDPVGVQLGGGLKNIVAIAAGISDGLEMGANAKAALVTRGLDEISSLGLLLGASEKTFMGLSGMGDVLLSSYDDKSRNRQLGLAIGGGLSFNDAVALQKGAPEGAHAIKTLVENGVVNDKQPVLHSVYEVLYSDAKSNAIAKELMQRPIKKEGLR
tara:strand:+ start:245 stop:1243 length:999 start_codon:yes stop_codon:yes gene_type:complete